MKIDGNRIKSLRQLWALVREDWTVNDRSWTRPGFQAMAVHRFGVWRWNIRRRIFRAPFSIFYNALNTVIRNCYGIELYETTNIGRRLRIAHQSGIVVHSRAVIGDDCLIRQGVSIGRASNHGEGVRALPPILGNRVEVGAGAVLVGGITIGDDVVIGPNAVVMTNVPAGSIVASPPARVLPRPPRAAAPKVSGTEEANETRYV